MTDYIAFAHTPDAQCAIHPDRPAIMTMRRDDAQTLPLCAPCQIASFDAIAQRARRNIESMP